MGQLILFLSIALSLFVHSLSARTAISPDIPLMLSVLLPLFFDGLGRDALIVTVVPFANVLGHLHISLRRAAILGVFWRSFLAWYGLFEAEIEQLESTLGTFPWGDISGQQS